MKNAWWWVVVVIVVLAIGGFLWWYMQTASVPVSSPIVEQASSTPTVAAVAPAPAANITARDNSDVSLGADLSEINSQITQLDADSQAAAQ